MMEYLKSEYVNGFGVIVNHETGEVSISFVKEEPIIDVDRMVNGEDAEIMRTEVSKLVLSKELALDLSKIIIDTVNNVDGEKNSDW